MVFRSNIPPVSESWKHDGFMLYADEFALLARAHLDHAIFISEQLPNMAATLPPAFVTESTDVLARLDETSMGQVRDLMLSFDALNL